MQGRRPIRIASEAKQGPVRPQAFLICEQNETIPFTLYLMPKHKQNLVSCTIY